MSPLDDVLRTATDDVRSTFQHAENPPFRPARGPKPALLAICAVAVVALFLGWRAFDERDIDNVAVVATSPTPSVAESPNGDLCFGLAQAIIFDAQDSYDAQCAANFATYSGSHDCESTEAGWVCSGPQGIIDLPPAPLSYEGIVGDPNTGCTGSERDRVLEAQEAYEQECAGIYDAESGYHSCAWEADGWRCTGPEGRPE